MGNNGNRRQGAATSQNADNPPYPIRARHSSSARRSRSIARSGPDTGNSSQEKDRHPRSSVFRKVVQTWSESRFFRLRGKGPESGEAFQADMERFHTNIRDGHEKAVRFCRGQPFVFGCKRRRYMGPADTMPPAGNHPQRPTGRQGIPAGRLQKGNLSGRNGPTGGPCAISARSATRCCARNNSRD